MNKDELKRRTKEFAHKCVKLAARLPDTSLGKHVRNQLTRASTSVAANYRAACLGQTKPVFIAKISIVIEEADECGFWLEFALDEKLLDSELINPLLKEANELTSIFIASRKTAEKSIQRQQSTINNQQ